ncbi:MAG: hypothetical protein D6723_06835 [Acidobacteria bacterium]|nr:MAG: hypothetical protein D6723_06835 [Acidobacteriota bacterium]
MATFEDVVVRVREGGHLDQELVERVARDYIETFGSVEDTMLYFEWLELDRQIDPDDYEKREALVRQFVKRAKGQALKIILPGMLGDVRIGPSP